MLLAVGLAVLLASAGAQQETCCNQCLASYGVAPSSPSAASYRENQCYLQCRTCQAQEYFSGCAYGCAGCYTCDGSGVTSESQCQGKTSFGTATPCSLCLPGTANKLSYVAGCRECAAGYYQDEFGQAACKVQAVCRPGQRTVQAGSVAVARVCENCPVDFTTLTGGEATCDLCVAGKYKSGSGCVACVCPTGAGQEYYINCPAGSRENSCPACRGGTLSVDKCPLGQEPNLRCDGTQTQNTECVPCPNGKHKPAATGGTVPYWCELCPTGTFKAGAGLANCGPCTNKLPLNGAAAVYEAWAAGANRGLNACPWSCVAGYYKPAGGGACVACNATRGTWAPAGTSGQCLACMSKPANSYYQQPRGFDGRSNTSANACPW
jgi:hypothetical protein